MSTKRRPQSTERKTALVYVRNSFTKDEKDKVSPERQRSLAKKLIEAEGLEAEWYEDAEGHKSGRFVKNRPGWLELEHRLSDPDVKTLIVYDLARLHRKGWRIGDLLEQLDQYEVDLVFTRPNYEQDTKTRGGKFLAQIRGMLDEDYAEQVSERTKAAIEVLRAEGKSVGATPFGTQRDEEGFLEPSPKGAWLLPDSRFVKGKSDQPPQEGAIWRGYYDCARYILEIYAENKIGMDKIAYRLNTEGWPFRDRANNPRPISQEDVRRVVANWPEYGGLVPETRAKDRSAHDDIDPARLIPARAVFPLELLQQVALVRKDRMHETPDNGIQHRTRTYPLSTLVYCAHCDKLAAEQNDPRLRERLAGSTDPRDKRRYKHKQGVACGCTNRTVPAEEIETEVGRLLKLLTVKEESLDYLTELAIQSQHGLIPDDEVNLQEQKQEAITLCKRRIDAAVHLYGDGRIPREEYLRRVEQNEREIAHWEARTTETERKALELTLCLDAVNRVCRLWESADDEDKQGMARHLFSEIVFDLDTRRIVSYKLKPWADDFLMLRMELYHEEFGDLEPGSEGYDAALEKANSNDLLGCWNAMPHRGIQGRSFPQVLFAVSFAMAISYRGLILPQSPVSGTSPKCVRNAEIRARHQKGETIATLAEAFGITEQRIWQILNERRK